MKSIKYMNSIAESFGNYRNIRSPHIRTHKFNGFAAFRPHKITKAVQGSFFAILTDPEQTTAVPIYLIYKCKIAMSIMVLYLINTYGCNIVDISFGKPPTTQVTASATMSQDTLNDSATSVQDSFFAQNARKEVNCLVTGDLHYRLSMDKIEIKVRAATRRARPLIQFYMDDRHFV